MTWPRSTSWCRRPRVADFASARRVAARFGWPRASVEAARQGHINETYFVTSDTGPWVLQRVNRSVFADVDAVTANILAVCGHLHHELVPTPVATADGAWLVHDGDDVWRAFVRVPGAQPLTRPTSGTVEQAATLLGTFHARTADLDPDAVTETVPGFHDLGRRVEALRQVVEADPCGRVRTVTEEIDTVLDSAPLAGLAQELSHSAPRRVAHNDAKLDNVLFRHTTAVCLIDLDTVMPGAWFWDVGDLLRSAATTGAEDDPAPETVVVDPGLYHAVLRGYRRGVSAGPVHSVELDALEVAGAIVTYEQAVRFLTDWLAGDLYYRTDRPGQNRDRARAQLRLFASMPRPSSRP